MKINFKLLMAAAVVLTAGGCDDKLDNNAIERYALPVAISLPANVTGEISNEKIEVRDVSSGAKTVYSALGDVKLKTGLYDVSYDADVVSDGVTRHVCGYVQSVQVGEQARTVAMTAYENRLSDDFIIQEIFFTGTLQGSGNQYYGDDYVKIYNNTDHVLYADGLTFVESKFLTTEKYDYTPDIMSTHMTVQAIYTIPGSGRDYPVEPGGSLLLADTGIDHRVANPNSFDLSGADFEWFDVSSQPAHLDIDGPTVPNLDKWYCYTQSFFLLHNRGFRAYALARIPVDKDSYLAENRYTYEYVMMVAAGTFPMSQTSYKLPNKWIVDAVNCSVEAKYAWNVTSPELDRGWTYCGTMDKDKSRYFHSVRRKMLYLKDGRPVLKDTDNSTEDFNPYCVPSEIERQGTAIDVNGTPCTTITWDGVVAK